MKACNHDTLIPDFTLSFVEENRNLSVNEQRLAIEILRVHAIEKQKYVQKVWQMNEEQLCSFFSEYQLFPQRSFQMSAILQHEWLKLIKNSGKIYFGLVRNKRRQGKGINISKQGKIYEGSYSSNEKNGFGIQIYPNGNLYLGEFMNGKKHGQGRFFWFSLSSNNPKADQFVEFYEGDWWGGLPDGHGFHQKINGDIYTGTFKNGLKHGEGTEIYGNGDMHKGQFVNGMAEGYGEYTWSDGSTFKGDFKQGLINGYGLWQANNNRIESYKGHYVMDKKSGYGVYTWDNGWSYRGNFEDDKRNGYGQLFQSDNKLHFRGFWENGEQIEKQPTRPQSRQKDKNYKNIQVHRPGSKAKEQVTQIFTIRKSSHNLKGVRMINSRDFNLAKKRPMSTSSGKKVRRSSNCNNQSFKGSHTKANTISSGSRVLVGTIKSNLFVPGRYASLKSN